MAGRGGRGSPADVRWRIRRRGLAHRRARHLKLTVRVPGARSPSMRSIRRMDGTPPPSRCTWRIACRRRYRGGDAIQLTSSTHRSDAGRSCPKGPDRRTIPTRSQSLHSPARRCAGIFVRTATSRSLPQDASCPRQQPRYGIIASAPTGHRWVARRNRASSRRWRRGDAGVVQADRGRRCGCATGAARGSGTRVCRGAGGRGGRRDFSGRSGRTRAGAASAGALPRRDSSRHRAPRAPSTRLRYRVLVNTLEHFREPWAAFDRLPRAPNARPAPVAVPRTRVASRTFRRLAPDTLPSRATAGCWFMQRHGLSDWPNSAWRRTVLCIYARRTRWRRRTHVGAWQDTPDCEALRLDLRVSANIAFEAARAAPRNRRALTPINHRSRTAAGRVGEQSAVVTGCHR